MKKSKVIINFLIRFFVTYFILLGIYAIYTRYTQEKGVVFSCDPITKTVAHQAETFGKWLGYNTSIEQNENELSMKFFIDGEYVARVVEGCNSISVIILFITFIIAFKGSPKATILYIVFGSLLIYGVNIARVFLLSLWMHQYPQYQYVLHNLIFPGIIYGTTFLLWVVWVNHFSHLKRKKS